MQTFGNICGGIAVLLVLALLYFVAAFVLGLVEDIDLPRPDNPDIFDRSIFWLRSLPLPARWLVFAATPLVIVVFGTMLFANALIDTAAGMYRRSMRQTRGSKVT